MTTPTDGELQQKVLAIYAMTGNGSEVARQLKMSRFTVADIVKRGRASGELEKHYAEMREGARALVESTLRDVVELASKRMSNEAWAKQFKSDPSPSYMKEIINTHRTLVHAEAKANERRVVATGDVTINVSGPAPKPKDDDPPDAVEVEA